MTAPTTTNDVEAVEEYAHLLEGDAQQWQEIAATATATADTLESEGAAWESTWEPEGDYAGAVALMVERLRALALTASDTARSLLSRGEGAVASSHLQAETDQENGLALENIDGVDVLARGDYPSMEEEAAVAAI